ncbi:pyocin knob domain-containing protein [Leuconostoc sp. MS02]|uniref:Pyocin knob domain-containing protein n=1 Tax=Leuconostoc aquikimchii TaxID=3236804 RepID=A0ABV3S291_9LACO
MAESYSKWIMTTAFANNSQAALNTGNKIEWVALKTSDDTHTVSDLQGFNDTTLATAKIKQTASINSVVLNGNTVTITGIFNSGGNAADYYIKTIFLVAKYNGTEFLAGVTIANSSGSAFRMPTLSTTEITEFTARPQITVTNSSTISTTVNPVAAATNERVNSLETSLNGKIVESNADKQKLWNKLADYVTKATAETITGVKTFTQTIVGSITGNAGTATKLITGRKINGVSFDGSADITVKASNDDKIVHSDGDQTIKGSLDLPNDNTMIRVGNNSDIGLVKKQGQSGSLVIGSSNQFKLQKSNNVKISPTDTFTDLMSVDQDGNIKAKSFSGIIQPREFSSADMNLLVESGIYKIPNSFKNVPVGMPNGGIVEVYTYDGNVTYQILHVQGSKIWKRYKFGVTWYDWNLLADDKTVVHNTGTENILGAKSFETNRNSADGIYLKVSSDNIDNSSHKIFWSRDDILNSGFGMNVGIGAGGNLIIGGGESAPSFLDALATGNIPKNISDLGMKGDSEYGIFSSDENVVLLAGYQSGGSTGKAWIFRNNGIILTPNGANIIEDNTGTLSFKKQDGTKMSLGTDIDGNAAMLSTKMLSSGEDLNNYKKSGFFICGTNAVAQALKNSPTTNAFSLRIYPTGLNDYSVVQYIDEYVNNTQSQTYKRAYYPVNGWGSWQKVAFDTNSNIWKYSQQFEGGVEISQATPFIDFHFGKSTDDWTSRIIESASGKLNFYGNGMAKMTMGANIDGNAATASAPNVIGISTNTDLNTLKNNGFYSFQGGTVLNSPVSNYFSLNVVAVGSVNSSQMLIDTNTGNVWSRGWNRGNTWTDWKKLGV